MSVHTLLRREMATECMNECKLAASLINEKRHKMEEDRAKSGVILQASRRLRRGWHMGQRPGRRKGGANRELQV